MSLVNKTHSREVWMGWISSLVEAYNMAIYSFTASFLASWIFKKESASAAVFFSYGLVFLGCSLFYPAGAFLYGYLGDKLGRRKTCTYSTLGLGLATGAMGLIPLQFLGEKTWICFLILLCLQHFFSGGEYHGSIVFSLEHDQKKKQGVMSAYSCLFAVFGLCLANALATYAQMRGSLIWVRGCFILGSLGGVISYLIKNHCRETPSFISISQNTLQSIDTYRFIKKRFRNVFGVFLILAFFNVAYSFIFIFLPLVHGDQIKNPTFDTLISLMIYGAFLVLSGYLADKIAMKNLMLVGAGLFFLMIVPLSFFCSHLLSLQIILTLCACLVIGPIHSFSLNQFQIHERCRGIFISSAAAVSLFGGSTVPICLKLFEKYSLVMSSLFPASVALLAFVYLFSHKDLSSEVSRQAA